ncbi:hypothetical protein ZWY2020_028200, partial [Hordeum vulgare]
GSYGNRRNKTHTLCICYGRRSFHMHKSTCSLCGYPTARIRRRSKRRRRRRRGRRRRRRKRRKEAALEKAPLQKGRAMRFGRYSAPNIVCNLSLA